MWSKAERGDPQNHYGQPRSPPTWLVSQQEKCVQQEVLPVEMQNRAQLEAAPPCCSTVHPILQLKLSVRMGRM